MLQYKFGGKEYQAEFDINTYDFGARNYDPALGRWMNIDPLAEYAFTHSPYHYAYNNPIYYIDPDGMMGIPMAVTSLGQGISGVGDIGGGGNELSQDSGGQRPDPQYPNTSGVQQLEEVNLGVVKKKDKGTDDGTPVYGMGTEDHGTKNGTRRGDFDMSEMPGGTGGARPTPSRFMNFWRDLLDILGFADDGKDAIEKYEPNESSMEKDKEEPVDPPEPREYYTRTHETWTPTGEPAGGQSTRPYEGSSKKYMTKKEAKKDSAAKAKYKFHPTNKLRRRDSVTIHKIGN